jgi:hypothetical protein
MKKSAKATQSAAVNPSNNSSQNDNQSTAPVVIATPHKQQTAKEAIAANVQLLIEQLEQGHSEGLTAYDPVSVAHAQSRGRTDNKCDAKAVHIAKLAK